MTSLFMENQNSMPKKTKSCQPGYPYQGISKWMTPGPGTTVTMDTAPILAMNTLHGLKAPKAKVELIF